MERLTSYVSVLQPNLTWDAHQTSVHARGSYRDDDDSYRYSTVPVPVGTLAREATVAYLLEQATGTVRYLVPYEVEKHRMSSKHPSSSQQPPVIASGFWLLSGFLASFWFSGFSTIDHPMRAVRRCSQILLGPKQGRSSFLSWRLLSTVVKTKA
jgi:hypothetical protein